MDFGPDGALWVLGWSSGYGAEWKDGQLTNEGRIFRVAWKDKPVVDFARSPAEDRNSGESHYGSLDACSIDELIDEFDSPLPVRRINAQDELVRRGDAVQQRLVERLRDGKLTENQETWTVWALGRMPVATTLASFLHDVQQVESKTSLNLQIQAIRVLPYRAKQFGQTERFMDYARDALRHPQPRAIRGRTSGP